MSINPLDRRSFLATSVAAASWNAVGQPASVHPAESTTADAADNAAGPVLVDSPVVSGPAPDSLTLLQPLGGPATGFLEFALDGGPYQRVDTESGGLLPFERHVLKFRFPPLPPGRQVSYRVTARTVSWQPVGQFIHGKIVTGEPEVGVERSFRTLDLAAPETRFVVWNDTHENTATLQALAQLTAARAPDFLLWNGDQTNDVHHESEMSGQFLRAGGEEFSASWPLAYVRGNHDVRGPAARQVPAFTGTPDDRFYYAFRSGPLAALVLDTGEDKPDDHPVFAGLAAFARFRERQTRWLETTVREPWFRDAPLRVAFCHIPLWWIRDRKDIDHWEYSTVCRHAWAPLLAAAGVKLVISGHTHHPAWIPAGPDQPLGQLIGGGPQPRHATFIEGTATQHQLTLTMQNLNGEVLQKLEFEA